MIKLKFNGITTEVNQNTDGLYRLNDVLKAFNPQTDKSPSDLVKRLSEFKLNNYQVKKVNGGKYRGIYVNERGIYWYAAKLDEVFESVVYETFEQLVNGNTNSAMDKALSVAVPQELINKEKRLRVIMNDLIKEKLGGGHAYSNYSKLICKCISGYIPSNLTLGDKSAFEYIVSLNHVDGAGAYIAGLEMAIMALKADVEYHSLAAMMQVQTTKNKSLFKEAA